MLPPGALVSKAALRWSHDPADARPRGLSAERARSGGRVGARRAPPGTDRGPDPPRAPGVCPGYAEGKGVAAYDTSTAHACDLTLRLRPLPRS
jgi:hypothetical protein